jgi:hypothetical protein
MLEFDHIASISAAPSRREAPPSAQRFALAVEQEPGDVQAHGAAPLLAEHAFHEGAHVLRELPLQLPDRPSVHRNGRSQPTK